METGTDWGQKDVLNSTGRSLLRLMTAEIPQFQLGKPELDRRLDERLELREYSFSNVLFLALVPQSSVESF